MQEITEYPEIIVLEESINVPLGCEHDENSITSNRNSKLSSKDSLSSQSFSALKLYQSEISKIKEFIKPTTEQLKEKLIFLGPKTKKYTLILDLDLTLVSSELVKSLPKEKSVGDYTLKINIRPYALQLIKEMSMYYEIIVFTAGSEEYAAEVVSMLDQNQLYIKKAVSRKNCVELKEGYVIKDLRIFVDREIKDILIVDDSVYSYAFQIENGVPIKPFDEDLKEDDEELMYLIQYLKGLHELCPDNLVEENKKKFWQGIYFM